MEEKIKKLSEKYLERVMELRRELHKYPELGFDLFKTADIVKKELDKIGIPYQSEIAKTGIVATIKGGKPILSNSFFTISAVLNKSKPSSGYL